MSKVYTNVPDGLRDLLRLAAGPADEAGELDRRRLALFPAGRGKEDSVSFLAVARGDEPSGLLWRACGHLAMVSSSREKSTTPSNATCDTERLPRPQTASWVSKCCPLSTRNVR